MDFRLSAISLQMNEFPASDFPSAPMRLSIRLFWLNSQKPVQNKARKGQRYPDARKSFP
jgi:hypothetical protein